MYFDFDDLYDETDEKYKARKNSEIHILEDEGSLRNLSELMDECVDNPADGISDINTETREDRDLYEKYSSDPELSSLLDKYVAALEEQTDDTDPDENPKKLSKVLKR